jgi:hypothetical protein
MAIRMELFAQVAIAFSNVLSPRMPIGPKALEGFSYVPETKGVIAEPRSEQYKSLVWDAGNVSEVCKPL